MLVLRHRAAPRTAEAAEQLGELARLQSETAVRLDAMADMLARRQVELQRAVNERLDAVSHRVGQSMQSTTQQTTENLQKLNERLAVIDTAQRNLTDLAAQVTSLRAVLTDKQSRGAFGQGRMEAIVQDGLPKGAFAFQVTLSNGKRPDCIIRLPDGRPLVIDAKFPLEAITAHKAATSDDQRKLAGQRLRQDVSRHVALARDGGGRMTAAGVSRYLASVSPISRRGAGAVGSAHRCLYDLPRDQVRGTRR